MAKENTVFLFGMVATPPRLAFDSGPAGKTINFMQFPVMTVRRSFMNEFFQLRGEKRTDHPIVYTRNSTLIEKNMQDILAGDIVLIKGSLSSREQKKVYICPNCNNEILIENAVSVYVDPIFVEVIEKMPEEYRDEKGFPNKEWRLDKYAKLNRSAEISNMIMIMGNLCSDPQFYSDPENKKKECQFLVAAGRKRRIIEDGENKKTDFLMVKAFGQKAEECRDALQTGSSIYINGALETRQFDRRFCCDECGTLFKSKGTATEVVPYSVEYIKNCNTSGIEGAEEES